MVVINCSVLTGPDKVRREIAQDPIGETIDRRIGKNSPSRKLGVLLGVPKVASLLPKSGDLGSASQRVSQRFWGVRIAAGLHR